MCVFALTSKSSIVAREYLEVGVQYVPYVYACVCAISRVLTRRTNMRRTCDMESRRGARISKPSKLGRAPISFPLLFPQCTCRNCESIRQEFATFGMQRGAFLSSLRTLSQHPSSLLRIHRFRFIPVLPTISPLPISVAFPSPSLCSGCSGH